MESYTLTSFIILPSEEVVQSESKGTGTQLKGNIRTNDGLNTARQKVSGLFGLLAIYTRKSLCCRLGLQNHKSEK
jgi:hypothetical protein